MSITLSNTGKFPIHDIEVLDRVRADIPITSGKNQYAITGIIKPGETRIFLYTIRPPKAGAFDLGSAIVMYADTDGNYHKMISNTAGIEVIEPLLKSSTDPVSDWLSTIQSWFT